MAVTAKLYGKLFTSLWNKEIDYDTDTIKVALLDNGHTPDQDTHDYFDDVVGDELANGSGYTSGGVTLSGKTVTYTGATNKHVLDANDSQWTSATITARYAVIYDASPGSDSTNPLIGYQDFGADVSVTSGTLLITWNASGIVEITVS